jgi:molybdate transport system substrate-binding protein
MRWLAITAALLCGLITQATAAEISAYVTIGMQHQFEELLPQFEKNSGHKVKATFGLSTALAKRIQDGETPDLVISGRRTVR